MRFTGLLALITLLLFGCGGNGKYKNPSGTLEATEFDISTEISGKLLEVRFPLGARVQTGDTLLILDTDVIQLQRTQTEANRTAILAQQLVATDAVRQARESLKLAESTLERYKKLFEEGSVTAQQMDELTTKRDLAQLQYQAAQHQVEALQAEEQKLNASLAVIDRQLLNGIVTAPSNGTILLRNAEPGEIAVPGQTLLRLADLGRMELRIYLGSHDLDRVKIGQTLPVVIDAQAPNAINGTVTWISSEAEFTPKNAQTRESREQLVYAVKLALDNSDGKLAIGMPAEVKF